MHVIVAMILMLWLSGCASPGFLIQPVEDDPSVFVGLASSPEGAGEAEPRYEHPVQWSSGDLQAILKRLAIQEGGGLMDASRPAQTVFSPDDLTRLIPALLEAFKIARPADRIVFAVWGASKPSQALEVTSGGLYLQDQQLHLLLANHRERVSSEEEGIHAIHHNPLRILRDVNRRLLFYPTNYIVESRQTWLTGGFDAPVSELILDYQALLASEGSENPNTTRTATQEAITLKSLPTPGNPSSAQEGELSTLQEEISTLKEELSRLKQQMKPSPAEPSHTSAP